MVVIATALVTWWSWPSVEPVITSTPLPRMAIERKPPPTAPPEQTTTAERLAQAALKQIGVTLIYDPAYTALAYPGGDVPLDRGVCSDVVIRSFRAIGIDLQRTVHEDMKANFAAYPKKWGLKKPDPNIDHRRVPNLMTWFARQGWELPRTTSPADYEAGDVVAWDLGRGLTHIGVVVQSGSVVHNIGEGAKREDVLFAWAQIGHYRRRDSR